MEKTPRVRGVLGEVRAEQYLAAQGWQILAHNVVYPGCEIDLIALEDACVVFIEVKARTRGVSGREAVTLAKQRRICRGALRYLASHGMMDRQARFDVIEIQGEKLTHIKDAFPYRGETF